MLVWGGSLPRKGEEGMGSRGHSAYQANTNGIREVEKEGV